MTYTEWKAELANFLSTNDFDIADLSCAYRFLVGVSRLMLGAPHPVVGLYQRLAESTIEPVAAKWVDCLSGQLVSVEIDFQDGNLEATVQLAGLIRACDCLIADSGRLYAGADADPNDHLIDGYFIVRRGGVVQPKLGEPFSRRGLLRHALIPSDVNGLGVKLWPTILVGVPRDDKLVKVAAAVFKDFKLVRDTNVVAGYIASAVDCPGIEQTVADQLKLSVGSKHLGVVWPELTIPPNVRAIIARTLRETADLEKPYPDIVVAGSWHEKRGTGFANTCFVYDAFGKEVVHFDKINPYISGALVEFIEAGDSVPVVVSDDFLVAFGICRDFCDQAENSRYAVLGVDYIFVPSLGDEKTMRNHRAVAKAVRTRTNARAFVVQQTDPIVNEFFAKVLAPMVDPLDPHISLDVKEEFSSYDGHS